MATTEALPRGGLPNETTAAESQGSAPVLPAAAVRRVVFDTNVLVSLFVFADSRFAPLRRKLESGAWQALTNDACFGEFRRVLAYPMFKLDNDAQRAALAAYDACVTRHMAPAAANIVDLPRCRDRDDQKFLELARDAGADWLVSADKDLLRLARRDRLRGLFRILGPEAALQDL
ncbi:MAG: putative toxin-antitoxin system toxin component, PIN family [Rhodocyclales bacterium]|nr:putative toxin-antitoxin system toxin component, PIN family [Rhodocyclales bacterium]